MFGTLVIRGYTQAFRQRHLPSPGPPPEDRGEAVRRILKHLQRKPIGDLGSPGRGRRRCGACDSRRRAAPFARDPHRLPRLPPRHPRARPRRDTPHSTASRRRAMCRNRGARSHRSDPRRTRGTRSSRSPTRPVRWWPPPHPPPLLARLPRSHHYATVAIEEGLLLDGAHVLVAAASHAESRREPLSRRRADARAPGICDVPAGREHRSRSVRRRPRGRSRPKSFVARAAKSVPEHSGSRRAT